MLTDDGSRSGGQPVGGGLVALADELRANLFAALRRHDVSEQCFAEAAMITQHFKTLLTADASEALGGGVEAPRIIMHLNSAVNALKPLLRFPQVRAAREEIEWSIAALKEPT